MIKEKRKRAPRKSNISRTERNNQLIAAIDNDWMTCNQLSQILDIPSGYVGTLAKALEEVRQLERSTILDEKTGRIVSCYRKQKQKKGTRLITFDSKRMKDKLIELDKLNAKDRRKAHHNQKRFPSGTSLQGF